MEPKLVYRSLRKISEWTLSGFYSEIYVSGQENIPEDGPVLVTPCHHNEILDVAALSVAMPYGRPVSYWAKASLFANPVVRAIMSSSGAIPVRRNPNSAAASNEDSAASPDIRLSLFRETFRAFDEGCVIGLFPEGTSYTEPQIAQIKEGAAWVALEYARWQLQHATGYDPKDGPKKLVLIPTGIVYTDKTAFRSRVVVAFGEPIDLEPYARRYLAAEREAGRLEIQKLTRHIENRLLKLTVNAPNWDYWFAAGVVRDILYEGDEGIPLKQFVGVSQFIINRLGQRFDTPGSSFREPESKAGCINALVKYSALLHYTGISHLDLAALYHNPVTPTFSQSAAVFVRELLALLLHPRFIAFLPILPIHLPAYAAGHLAGKYLASSDEPETQAEHKAVCGGLVLGVVSLSFGHTLAGACKRMILTGLDVVVEHLYASGAMSSEVGSFLTGLLPRNGSAATVVGAFGTAATMYTTTWLIFRWHSALVRGNLTQFNRTAAAWKVLLGVIRPPTSQEISPEGLASISRPPLPKPNPFITRRISSSKGPSTQPPSDHRRLESGAHYRVPPTSTLIRPLLAARADAEASVRTLFA